MSGGWAIWRGSTSGYYLADIYMTSGSYAARDTVPSHPAYYDRLLSSGWVDTNGYAKILSISSTQITVRVLRGSYLSFPNVYYMAFRFYAERLSFSNCRGVSFSSNRYSSNFKTLSGCSGSNKYFYAVSY